MKKLEENTQEISSLLVGAGLNVAYKLLLAQEHYKEISEDKDIRKKFHHVVLINRYSKIPPKVNLKEIVTANKRNCFDSIYIAHTPIKKRDKDPLAYGVIIVDDNYKETIKFYEITKWND